jgi:hypothetical protein
MTIPYFAALLPELATRAARATVSRLGFSNASLRAHLMEVFSRGYGERGAFLGEPVFEATFGWQTDPQTMLDLAGTLLHPDLVAAMDEPPAQAGDYRFPRDASPYAHQVAAWRHLLAPEAQSVVVTSGTGSGKSECFMVPILHRLITEQRQRQAKLVGVRALFLYPLNALIQSQRERLSAWTHRFGGDLRFCLYNGLTPNKLKQEQRNATPNEVVDREVLRASPPPILVTNPTMLEYMLVRAEDAPILDASKGALEWVVLDEAHTYIGSQAAELALLLRRVLHAFGVRAEAVRFVATSATIGSDAGKDAETLRTFVAKLAGVAADRVHVVSGHRQIPALPALSADTPSLELEALEALGDGDPVVRYAALCGQPQARALRSLFVPADGGKPANSLQQIVERLAPGAAVDHESKLRALRWVDCLTSAQSALDRSGKPFLPLRLHAFHNVLSGLWACSDGDCSFCKGTPLDDPDWPFGMVFCEERRHCVCGAPVFELRSCNDCNATYLWGRRVHQRADGRYRLLPSAETRVDEFTLDVEPEDDAEELSEEEGGSQEPVLIANGRIDGTADALVERSSGLLDPPDATNTIRLRLKDRTHTQTGWRMECPECGGHHAVEGRMFRRAILGAPFILGEVIPTLLEFCPDGERPASQPRRGRRLITFTDSRQGTARIAAKLQQDAERDRVRGAIYLHAISGARGASPEALAEIDRQITALAEFESNAALAPVLAQKRAEREQLTQPKSVSFADMAHWLGATVVDVRDWMHRYYQGLDPALFEGPAGQDRLARILVMREFARRPKRLNSLETMGLVAVRYPKLDALQLCPPEVQAAGISLTDWKAFLKTALDFYVRENTFIDLHESWRKWGGNRIAAKLLLGPESKEQQTNRLKRWPQCNAGGQQNRLVRVLAFSLKVDPETGSGKDRIDGLLRAAWSDLVRVGLLQAGADGRYLSIEDLAFAPIVEAWVCPITRRILDNTFRGVTPYLPRDTATPSLVQCRPVTMPLALVSLQDFPTESERVHTVRAWADANETVIALRKEGLWPDLNDRIVEGGAYFRAVEHSAQQAGSRLQAYERDFKAGLLNVLSCSTTMEMGVDIGGINMVAMNNVPPHPANYLQRAGRAGRRGETRSVALTLCKSNPHDQLVFGNPLWAFTTHLPAPSISLSSPVLVQRHINAMLLSTFLRAEAATSSLEKLDMEWWMLPIGGARLDRFVAWASCFEEAQNPSLVEGLNALLRHTVFEGRTPLERLAASCAAAAQAYGVNWKAEFQAIESQESAFSGPGKDKDPAFKSLQIQKRRITGEYLLRELASGGFLPGYGFPTGITSFDTLNKDLLERVRLEQERASDGKKRRIDNPLRRRELPSRDTVTALREYAPGAEIVIDGLVYRSAGITLNWHAPASAQDVSEIQNIRAAWRCRACGACGTSVLAEKLSNCPDCGAALTSDGLSRFKYLEPAGFAVDLYEATHNDVSVQTYVPVEAPWIHASGEWMPLANPALGRFRASSIGTVFNHSAGAFGLGFAVCLECGRAEPMMAPTPEAAATVDIGASLPGIFRRPHRRLRGAQGGETKICAGSDNPFSIQTALHFGGEATTDVLELVLRGLDGQPLHDRQIAYSIAVALRNAVASYLGIEEGELGCDTKEIRADGKLTHAVIVFDKNASGYASSMAPHLAEVLRWARNHVLQCSEGCESACHHCLLSFDTRYRLEDLDRRSALEFLSDRWLDELNLQEKDAHFGVGKSFAEYQTLPEALTREFGQADATELWIYLGGQHDDWDLAGSSLRKWLHRWTLEGKRIRLLVPALIAPVLTPVERFTLQVLKSYGNVTVSVGDAPACPTAASVVATVIRDPGAAKFWALLAPEAATPDAAWGQSTGAPWVWGYATVGSEGPALELNDAPVASGGAATQRLDIASELDGPVDGFGGRLLQKIWQALPEGKLPGKAAIREISYRDRYLNAPLPAMLLLELISALKGRCLDDDRWALERVHIVTSPVDASGPYGPPLRANQNWPSTDARNEAVAAAFAYCGMDCALDCLERRETGHARSLVISLEDGAEVSLWFDQGFGYWATPRDFRLDRAGLTSFPFSGEAAKQGEALASPKLSVVGQTYPTHIFLSVG